MLFKAVAALALGNALTDAIPVQPSASSSAAAVSSLGAASAQLSDSITAVVDRLVIAPVHQLNSALGVHQLNSALVTQPAGSDSSVIEGGDQVNASLDQTAATPGSASWQDYMSLGIHTGIGFAELGAGTAAGTNDPITAYAELGQHMADSFDALNQKGYGGSASADGGSRRRAAVASWQDYMTQGIHTGVGFAQAGEYTAAGTNDPSTAYATLRQQTADSFDQLGHKGEDPGEAPPESQQQPAPEAVAPAASTPSSAAPQPAAQGGASWQDYIWQGIHTGIGFAELFAPAPRPAPTTQPPPTLH